MLAGASGAWYNVSHMDTGVGTRHVSAALPSVPPRSRRLERRLAGAKRSRPPTTVVVLLIGVILLLAGLLWWVTEPSSTPHPSVSSSSLTTSANAVRQATAAVTQAGTVMSLQLASRHTLPTVASVAIAVDPYLVALETYQVALSAPVLNSRAAVWRRNVVVRIQNLETLLKDLPNTPSGQLGSWINGFYLQTAELQTTIQGLEAALPEAPAS
jgi:hypothetical protein